MAAHDVVLYNGPANELQEAQAGDTYNFPVLAHFMAGITTDGLIDGRDVAADGAIVDLALIPGDNLSELTNDMFASQGEAEAGTNETKLMNPLRVRQAIETLGAGLKHNYTAIVDPSATDDENSGYSVGSVWVNTDADEAFKCVDATANVAVWVKTTVSANDLAAVALSGNSDDLTEGSTNLLMTQDERDGIAALTTIEENITAYAGGGQTNAYELTSRYSIVATCASAGDSVKLADSTPVGGERIIRNDGAQSLDIFPQSGGRIDNNGNNNAESLAAGSAIRLFRATSTRWYSS